jgi:hypothetical protein
MAEAGLMTVADLIRPTRLIVTGALAAVAQSLAV